jgi:ADP-heptose:LPS heptosyltransferase
MDGEEVPVEQPPAEEAAAVDPPPAEGEPPAAMDGEEVPAPDGMEGPVDMEGPVSGDMEDVDMDGEPAEDEFDYSSDERMKLMINHISENLETFTFEEHWKSEHYAKLNTFLSESSQRVLFFWSDFDDNSVLRVSDDQPPKFYGQDILAQDF